MHVAWVPAWYPTVELPLNGVFFFEQVSMLADAGVDTHVITASSCPPWVRESGTVTCDDHNVIRAAIPTIPLGLLPGERYLASRVMRRAAAEYERRWGVPDVLHAQSVFPAVIAAQWLGQHWGIPWGVTEHRPSTMRRHQWGWRYRAIAHAVRDAAFRCAVSPTFSQKLSDYYGAPFTTYRLPVPDDYFSDPRSDTASGCVLLHISTCEPRKNVEATIRAFADVHRDHPQTRLRIVGGNADRVAELRAFATTCEVGDAVDVLGTRQRDELSRIIRECDCFILISAEEANGVVYAEALAAGLPIIASDTWGGKYAATSDVGIVVPSDSHTALVEAMTEMVDPDHRRDRFDPRQLQNVAKQRYSAEVFVREMTALYQQAMSSSR